MIMIPVAMCGMFDPKSAAKFFKNNAKEVSSYEKFAELDGLAYKLIQLRVNNNDKKDLAFLEDVEGLASHQKIEVIQSKVAEYAFSIIDASIRRRNKFEFKEKNEITSK